MLRSGNSFALYSERYFVDTLLRRDYSIRRYPYYGAFWYLPQLDLHQQDIMCLLGTHRRDAEDAEKF